MSEFLSYTDAARLSGQTETPAADVISRCEVLTGELRQEVGALADGLSLKILGSEPRYTTEMLLDQEAGQMLQDIMQRAIGLQVRVERLLDPQSGWGEKDLVAMIENEFIRLRLQLEGVRTYVSGGEQPDSEDRVEMLWECDTLDARIRAVSGRLAERARIAEGYASPLSEDRVLEASVANDLRTWRVGLLGMQRVAFKEGIGPRDSAGALERVRAVVRSLQAGIDHRMWQLQMEPPPLPNPPEHIQRQRAVSFAELMARAEKSAPAEGGASGADGNIGRNALSQGSVTGSEE